MKFRCIKEIDSFPQTIILNFKLRLFDLTEYFEIS